MIRYENQCVGCPPEMGCMGEGCPKRNVPVPYCDECDNELDPNEIYEVDGQMLCEECLKRMFRRSRW